MALEHGPPLPMALARVADHAEQRHTQATVLAGPGRAGAHADLVCYLPVRSHPGIVLLLPGLRAPAGSPAQPLRGLSNYTQLFDPVLNPTVAPALIHTVIWTLLEYVYVLPLSLLLASCLVKITHGRTLFQIVLFLPVITPLVVVGLLMGHLFDPRIGLLNQVLHAVGLPGSQWLHDPILALPLAAGISAWRWLGLYTILFTAAMVNIPRDVGDAARVDGAGGWILFCGSPCRCSATCWCWC